jgi:hypothetical protein
MIKLLANDSLTLLNTKIAELKAGRFLFP